MLRINNLVIWIVGFGAISQIADANVLHRARRQSENGNGEIIDNIFNIPITAIKQTAAAAQSIYPEGGSSIDSVFNIPVATLEAVGNLVKNRNSFAQRRPMDSAAADIQKRRKERKDRIHAHRKGQRLQHNDPFGVNALTDLLVGHHGLFSGHGLSGGHGGWGGHLGSLGDHLSINNLGSHLSSHFGGHGSSHGDGDNDDHDSVGGIQDGLVSASSSSSSSNDGGYEVTEAVDDNRSGWGGWFDFGSLFGGSSASRAQNKIAPRPDRQKYGRYDDRDAPLENKIAPKYARTNYGVDQDDRPLENKIAPKSDRRSYQRNYQRNYADSSLQDRSAPRREGRNRLVFEHRSF